MPQVFVSIGSNIDRDQHIPRALNEMEDAFGKLTLSSVYETEPVGFSGDNFYNLVVGFDSDLPVKQVGKILKEIETGHRRDRIAEKFSARTLDLDLLLYGDLVIEDGKIKVPRSDVTEYAFVLEPLAEIAPHLKHPVLRQTYQALWAQFDKSSLWQARVEKPWLGFS